MARSRSKEPKLPQLRLTVVLTLDADPAELFPTARAYTSAFNLVAKAGFDAHLSNRNKLHSLTYGTLKNNIHLPSQLICSSINKAAEALKSIETKQKNAAKKKKSRKQRKQWKKKKEQRCPVSLLQSITYDARSYSIDFKAETVSLSTLEGRKKIPFTLPDRDKKYLRKGSGWRYTSAELCYWKQHKQFKLHICFQKDAPAIPGRKCPKVFGGDRGEKNLLTLSNGINFGGQAVIERRERFIQLRAALQECGSKSAKRHLRRLRGKEKRFMADINHCISKLVIAMMAPGDILVLENLKGIREHGKRRTKKARRQFHNWAYSQLEMFLLYKALAAKVRVEFVNAAFTSQRCPECGHTNKANRKGSCFRCKQCSFESDADLIGAINIAVKWLDLLDADPKKGSGHSAYRLQLHRG